MQVTPGRFPIPPAWGFDVHEDLAGVFVGGCVERGEGSSFRRMAHAHNTRKDPFFGWICVRSTRRVMTDSGQPTVLMFHELAHILTPGHGHTEKWAAVLSALGYPAEARRVRATIARTASSRWKTEARRIEREGDQL